MVYDLIIVGGGPAGCAAGIYAARKRIKSVLITEFIGGQSTNSLDIQNWIGIVSMSGIGLAERLKKHLEAYADDVLDIKTGLRVVQIKELEKAHDCRLPLFEVRTNDGKSYLGHTLIFTLGSRRRKLQIKGAKEFDHRGISYCASCDAPLYRDMEVAVIGGGNAGLESAEQLLSYAKNVHIFEISSEFKADKLTQERVLKNHKVIPHLNSAPIEIKGDKTITSLLWKDKKTGRIQETRLQGIFVEIGSVPNTDMLKGLVKMNDWGEIIIDHKTCRTSLEGIWAAGDATDQPYKQNNIAMGDAVKALEDVYLYLQKLKNK